MRSIRPDPSSAKNKLVVAKPGVAPARVAKRAMPIAPQVQAPSTRDYGKAPSAPPTLDEGF